MLINNNILAKHHGMYPGGGGVYIPPGPAPTPVPLYGVVKALYAVPIPVEYQQSDQ